MGCQLAKENDRIENDKHTNTKKSTVQTMASESTNAVDYKSRLEWKICVVSRYECGAFHSLEPLRINFNFT